MTPIRIYLDSWNGALHAQPSGAAAKARTAKRKAAGSPGLTDKPVKPGRPARDSWVF